MICSRCIYDDKIPYITFNEKGVCNYCDEHDKLDKQFPTGEEGYKILQGLAEKIKKDGKNKKYDCVVGVSGGCDSSYTLYLTKKLGLKPLAVHCNNGWNTETSISNLNNILLKLKVDLFSIVVDEKEGNDIFKSCLLASIPECDLGADIGLATTMYIAAEKYKIKYIFQGHNFRSEGISPQGWVYMDGKYLKSVHDKYGVVPLKTYPNLWFTKFMKWVLVDRMKIIRPLYYVDYDKEKIKEFLSKEFDWKWYGGHHCENKTAAFANHYYLIKKFGIFTRYTEYSALVRYGKMTREEALEKLKTPQEFDETILTEIKQKLNITNEQFEDIMKAPNKSYRDFKTYKKLFERLKPFFWILAKLRLVPLTFYTKYTKRYD
jgi:N-acetyl sugar amidotransferase